MAGQNPQLDAWTGEFGDLYIGRNEVTKDRLMGKVRAWTEMLRPALMSDRLDSILEIGANIGLNLRAISELTDASLYALEPNAAARERLISDQVTQQENILDGSAQSIPLPDASIDLVFTSTVLIHVDPEDLPSACREIHRVAKRYVLCNEYFSAQPETLAYRGRDGLLFKRDFGAFWLDNFKDITLVDYGFLWRRAAAMDSTTWWLFRKNS